MTLKRFIKKVSVLTAVLVLGFTVLTPVFSSTAPTVLRGTVQAQGTDEEGNTETCESAGATALSWLLCPLLYLGDAAMRKLDQAIMSLLSVPNEYVENTELETAWRRLRDIAYIILVPIVLVMVISTALGFDFISAYTVKRAMPRLIVAVIFIALSFEITKFLVIFTNNVGTGVGGIVLSAFTGAREASIASVFSPNQSDSVVAAPIFIGVLAGTAVLGGLAVILSYIFVAIIGLMIGFFLLSFRQLLIIALMLLAPLAILAWIFPGNDRLWKLWWITFSKLLMLFPLIILLISVGKAFSLMVADTDGSFVSTLIKLVAYIGPYFMIPATFKFAGGIFANISGMVNDRQRGIFDRQKNFRRERVARNKGLAQRNARWNPNSRLGKLNDAASWVADPMSNAQISMGTQKGRSIMNRVNQSRMEASAKLAGQMSQAGFNDKALGALTKWDGSTKGLQDIAQELEDKGGANNIAGAKYIRDNADFLKNIYDDDDVGRADVKAAAGLALASQGFITPDQISDIANGLDSQDPRFRGMGSMFKTQAELAGAKSGALTKPGYSVVPEMQYDQEEERWVPTGRFTSGSGTADPETGLGGSLGADISRIRSIGVGDLANAKGPTLQRYKPVFKYVLNAPVGTEYIDLDGERKVITQDFKDSVAGVLQSSGSAYNNADLRMFLAELKVSPDKLDPVQAAEAAKRATAASEDEANKPQG